MVKAIKEKHLFYDSFKIIMTKKEAKNKLPNSNKKYYIKFCNRRIPIEIVSNRNYKKIDGQII